MFFHFPMETDHGVLVYISNTLHYIHCKESRGELQDVHTIYVHIMYLKISRDRKRCILILFYENANISRGEIFYLPTSPLISSCNKYRIYWKIGFSASVLWKELKRWIFHLSTISLISGCVLYSTIMMRLNMDFPLAFIFYYYDEIEHGFSTCLPIRRFLDA
jgi:hypothetical protein